jgi:probable rRNA maturation factor
MRSRLRRIARNICADSAPDSPPEVSISLVDDPAIRALNVTWRAQDKATDVLSFPQFEPPFPAFVPVLGDVVISVDTAARQAAEVGHSLGDELAVLLVHAMMHLLGHRHDDAQAAERMAEAEDKWLRRSRIDAGLVGRARGA